MKISFHSWLLSFSELWSFHASAGLDALPHIAKWHLITQKEKLG
jgi:hypothetical protein